MAVGAPKPPVSFPDPTRHMHMVVNYLSNVGDNLNGSAGPVKLPTYTTVPDNRPTASEHTGSIIYVSDTSKVQFSNGTAWGNI